MLRFIRTSKYGLAGVVLTLSILWHFVDKEIAVQTAEETAANKATIASLEKELKELKRRQLVTALANSDLKTKVEIANEETIKAQKEIMKYVENSNEVGRPTVNNELFGRMRSRK